MSEDYNELWAELLDVDIYGGLSYEELTQISANLPIGTKGGDIAQAALSKVGTAYSVMDCSQLTQYAYAQAGIPAPHLRGAGEVLLRQRLCHFKRTVSAWGLDFLEQSLCLRALE